MFEDPEADAGLEEAPGMTPITPERWFTEGEFAGYQIFEEGELPAVASEVEIEYEDGGEEDYVELESFVVQREYSAQALEEGAYVDGMAEGVRKGFYEDQEEPAGKLSDYYGLGEENAAMNRKEPEEQPEVSSDSEDVDILSLRKPKNSKTKTSYFYENPLTTLAHTAVETCTPMPLPEPAVAIASYTDENQWCLVNKFAGTTATVASYVKPTDEEDKNSQIFLEPDTMYMFRVAAVNSVGQSEWSEYSTFKTSQPGYPGAPSQVKIVQSIVGAHMSWQPPTIISGNIIEYSVYLSVKPLRTINAGASTSGTIVHLEALQMTFKLVYRGPASHCFIQKATLSTALIDSSSTPAIILRVAARNMKGYGPAKQARWLQEPTPTVIVPPLVYRENFKLTKKPLKYNVESINEPVAAENVKPTKKPVAVRNVKPPMKPNLKNIMKSTRMPFVKAVKKSTNLPDVKEIMNSTKMPDIEEFVNPIQMPDVTEIVNPNKLPDATEIVMPPKKPGPRYIIKSTSKPFSRALVDTTKMSEVKKNVKMTRLPSNKEIAEMTRLPSNKEIAEMTRLPSNKEIAEMTRLPTNKEIAEMTRLRDDKENVNPTKMPVLRRIMKSTKKPFVKAIVNSTKMPVLSEIVNRSKMPDAKKNVNPTKMPVLSEIVNRSKMPDAKKNVNSTTMPVLSPIVNRSKMPVFKKIENSTKMPDAKENVNLINIPVFKAIIHPNKIPVFKIVNTIKIPVNKEIVNPTKMFITVEDVKPT